MKMVGVLYQHNRLKGKQNMRNEIGGEPGMGQNWMEREPGVAGDGTVTCQGKKILLTVPSGFCCGGCRR